MSKILKISNCADCDFLLAMNNESVCTKNPPSILTVTAVNPISQKIEMSFVTLYPKIGNNFPRCGEYRGSDVEN